MEEQKYKELLYVLDDHFEKETIVMTWQNGMKVRCKSFTGMYETDTEPEEDDYIGEYAAAVNDCRFFKFFWYSPEELPEYEYIKPRSDAHTKTRRKEKR